MIMATSGIITDLGLYNNYPDAVLPVHIVSNHEATAKSTIQDGGMAETSVNALVHRSVDVST